MTLIRAHRQNNGTALVTVNGQPLALPTLLPGEVRHSPTGFEFGYGGSGPVELARAILIALYRHNATVRHPRCYQRFKWKKIAFATGDVLELTNSDVDDWDAGWQESEFGQDTMEHLVIEQMLAATEQPTT